MSETIISLSGVSKTFVIGRIRRRKVEALKDVSLEVMAGDIYGFLGPNGAGKTTAVRCILGLSLPNGGKIVRFGQERFDRGHFFSRTAYCPEESHFPPYITGREMLKHWAGMYGLEKKLINARVGKAIETIGLEEAADRRIGTYSKGMKQRIGIAGCLLTDPQLVIMDEPARGLDPLGRHLIRNIILRLAEAGKTIFINSHILSEVERVCSRAAIINEGVIRRELKMSDLEQQVGIEVVYKPGPEGQPAPENAVPANQNMMKLTLPGTAELAEFAKAVADAGGEIVSANKSRIDLEDYFIQVVEEGDK